MGKLIIKLVALSAVAWYAGAEAKTVTGQVLSHSDGQPVVGATVMAKGTQVGTMTDVDGKFTLENVPESAKTLQVSYVGMKTLEVPASYAQAIELMDETEQLEEVVVTALGISRSEKTLGYAATQVSGAEIQNAQTTNAMQALQGKVPGLMVQTTSADPGAANNVVVRGVGSINGSNQPLYVVDGVPMDNSSMTAQYHQVAAGGVTNISPDDIASMTVLKGAAATALYGSRASNGVIIITTKSGSGAGGKNFTLTYSGNLEWNAVSVLPDMQNRWGQGWNGGQTYIENGSWGPELNGTPQVFGPIWNNSQLLHMYDAKKNNVRDFFDTGFAQTHNVALSGVSRDGDMTYYASYSYTGNNGIMPSDKDTYSRNTVSVRGSYKPVPWAKISTSMNLATWKTKTVGNYQGTSVVDGLYEMPRDVSTQYLKDLDNPFNTPEAYFTPYGITNPYWAIANNYNQMKGKQVFGKLQLDANPIPELTLSYRFGFDYSDFDYKVGYPQISLDDALINEDYGYAPSNMNQAGWVYDRFSRQYELNHDFLAVYANKFLDQRLDLNATLGFNINERGRNSMWGQSDNLAINTGFWQLSNGATWTALAESQFKRRLLGLFADVTLGWDDFLYLDVTARNDWSSTLPLKHNSFFYPGVTLSTIFTRWIPKNDILSFGKVRLAYGKTGNDASPYYTNTSWIQGTTAGIYGTGIIKFPFNSTNAFVQSATAGTNTLRPEMTTEFEAGTNLKFFNGRVDIDFSYYHRTTTDQIFTLPIDPSTGFTQQVTNFGKVRNQGVELMVNTTPVKTPVWRWDLGLNFSKNWNKVMEMPASLEGGRVTIDYFAAGNDAVYLYAEKGMPIGTYYTYLPQFVTDSSSPYYGCPIVDEAGQPVIGKELEYTGYNMNHDWTGGLTTALSAYGVTLSAAFDIRIGGHMFSRTKNLMQFTGNGKMTEYNERHPFIVPNSVVANGDGTYRENTTPLYLANTSIQDYFNNTGWGHGGNMYMLDRSYCKLRNISLSWTLPTKWVSKAKMSEVTITAYCNNAFVWTAKSNRFIDPETTSAQTTNELASSFGELYSNPSCRTFGMNLKVTF